MRHHKQNQSRVVITGLGAITPLGNTIENIWENLLSGVTTGNVITQFDVSQFQTKIAANVQGFNPQHWLEKKDAKRLDPFIAYAVAAAKLALDDAKITIAKNNSEHIGIWIGSGFGGINILSQETQKLFGNPSQRVSPFLIPYMIPNMASGILSILLGTTGVSGCTVTACASGAQSIGDAFRIIQQGKAKIMIAGGSDAPINPICLAGFSSARALTTNNDNPKEASRPFDKNRDGFLLAEGAGILILEDYEHAKQRDAKIYAEVIGYGLSSDAYHITSPHPEGLGATMAMKKCIEEASISPEEIDYINAHGTSTKLNDAIETKAIKNLFTEHASNIPISSTKSMMGHTQGAAGAIEAIVCALSIKNNRIHPTTNYETPDEECNLNYTTSGSIEKEVNYALTNSFGFGGHNVSLLFRKT